MPSRTQARAAGDGGQIFPLVLLAALGLLLLGAALFQVGRGADYKARAQTGADAAAVAGARTLGLELGAGLGPLLQAHQPPAVPVTPPVALPIGAPALLPVPVPVPDLPVLGDVLRDIDTALVRSAARSWADRNDTELVQLELDTDTLTVRVTTRTKGELDGFGGGQRGNASASARLTIDGLCLPAPAADGRAGIRACDEGEQPGLGNADLTVELVD